ncbi:uncharacterized protein G2W53_026408 [Senna tora]|uniref:Uncharacterized protein n=1 Tax=Senna tora TaxID=362788 RepID=A0A834WHE2_9FABA|nr:uncharacterized protein G2W53_026408 [Senna tora]
MSISEELFHLMLVAILLKILPPKILSLNVQQSSFMAYTSNPSKQSTVAPSPSKTTATFAGTTVTVAITTVELVSGWLECPAYGQEIGCIILSKVYNGVSPTAAMLTLDQGLLCVTANRNTRQSWILGFILSRLSSLLRPSRRCFVFWRQYLITVGWWPIFFTWHWTDSDAICIQEGTSTVVLINIFLESPPHLVYNCDTMPTSLRNVVLQDITLSSWTKCVLTPCVGRILSQPIVGINMKALQHRHMMFETVHCCGSANIPQPIFQAFTFVQLLEICVQVPHTNPIVTTDGF